MVKELKAKIKELEGTIAKLRAEQAALEYKSELLLSNKSMEVQLRMQKEIAEAYDKGFDACKAHFLSLKQLQTSLGL